MFVTFEGPEGAGKTTLIRSLSERLLAKGHNVLVTREPGAGPVGAKIRELLLGGDEIVPRAEIFLFLADRAQHIDTIIRPALAQGKIVLCDRHMDSTIVYQGYGRGVNLELLRTLGDFTVDGLKPTITFLLDLDPIIGLQRQLHMDRMGALPLEFHQRVAEGFRAEAAREPARWQILDASLPADAVVEQADKFLSQRLQS